LFLHDEKKRFRAMLTLGEAGTDLVLYDEAGAPRASLSVHEEVLPIVLTP
jgi:hypothetical protein